MSNFPRFEVLGIPDVPHIEPGDDVACIYVESAEASGVGVQEHDIAIIASKAVSSAEGRIVNLSDVEVSQAAWDLHARVPRKSPEVCELIIRETNGNVHVKEDVGHILGTLPNGMQLTAGGVDKLGDDQAVLLPENSDHSARRISEAILEQAGVNVAVVISDSEGRPDRQGAGAVALGVYGMPALRKAMGQKGSETFCDFLANAASIILGQRGTGYPFAVIRGLNFQWDTSSGVNDILNRPR